MDDAEIPAAYVALAEKLYQDASVEQDLAAITAHLPAPNRELLARLAGHAQARSLDRPRYAWALMAVSDATLADSADHLLRALTAWQLGCAANDWGRPDRAQTALRRARAGFETLNEEGWISACDWQLYALPWIGSFSQAETALTHALEGLARAQFDRFAPHCRLALAYAQILTGSYAQAAENIEICEREFSARDDTLSLARCLITRARGLRQQSRFDTALDSLGRALTLLKPLHTPIDVAKAHYQLAYCKQYLNDDFQSAEAHFLDALEVFEESDLPLWSAQCCTALAQIYSNMGRLVEANHALERAEAAHAVYQANGPYADYLVNHGKLQLLLGNETTGLGDFQQAEALYAHGESRLMAAVAAMYQGEAYNHLGYYQHALRHLERAYTRFDDLHYPDRLAECAMLLTHTWLQLSRPEMAHAYLDKATEYYERKKQYAFLANVYNFRASLLLFQGNETEAIAYLHQALLAAEKQGPQPQIALAQRLLGEALCAVEWPEEALVHLGRAHGHFVETGMSLEQAICLAALGECYFKMSNRSAARDAWQKALDLSQGVMPDTDWQAWAGLAQLAEEAENVEPAKQAYSRMLGALTQLRRGFSQPTLAGSYLQRPALALDRAVTFAARIDEPRHAAQAIEASKAQTIVRQLIAPDGRDKPVANSELGQLEVEIRSLHDRLRVRFDSAHRRRSPDERALIAQLRRKHKQYHVLLERLERETLHSQSPSEFLETFDLIQFRGQAAQRLGQAWIALDYYMTNSHVICVTVTNTDCSVWQRTLTSSLRFALDTCANAPRSGRYPTQADLSTLGRLLLPPMIGQRLTPDTYLLIAPHRQLHRVPWAALLFDKDTPSLVQASIPAVIPSLQGLTYLWLRLDSSLSSRTDGLLLGVSDFGGRRQALPQVAQELADLLHLPGDDGHCLANADATWANVTAWKPVLMLATEQREWHVSHCRK